MLGGGAPPASWTSQITAFIRTITPNHLIVDGADGLVDFNGALQNQGFQVAGIDMM